MSNRLLKKMKSNAMKVAYPFQKMVLEQLNLHRRKKEKKILIPYTTINAK